MKQQLLAFGFAGACSAAVFAMPATAQQSPASGAQPHAQHQAMEAVTVEGCLMREADAPGRRPIDADRETVKRDDDYVLTDSKMVKGAAPAASEPRTGDPRPAGTSGTASPQMFKVEKLSTEQLHGHRNQRVRLEGTFRYAERAGNATSPANDLVKIDATKITPADGSCPAK